MPITRNGGVITYTTPENQERTRKTDVFPDTGFAICDPANVVKQLQFDVNALDTNPGTLTLKADIAGDATIDLTDMINPTPNGKVLYVNGNRLDSYTADGSAKYPYKTIQAAFDAVVAAGDNATYRYLIDIIGQGTYAENLTLNSLLLYGVVVTGHGGVFITPATGNSLTCTANNSNLSFLIWDGIIFSKDVILSGDTNASNFCFTGSYFYRSTLLGNLTLTNCNNVEFIDTAINGAGVTFAVTNCGAVTVQGGDGATSTITVSYNGAAPAPPTVGTTVLFGEHTILAAAGGATMTVGANCLFIPRNGCRVGVTNGTFTNNGTVQAYNAFFRSNYVNNGTSTLNNTFYAGTYTEAGTTTLVNPAPQINYSPAVSASWSPVPTVVSGALDTLAANKPTNYIANSIAESATTGWATYNDQSAVTFSNGSATITWATNRLNVGEQVQFTTTGALPTNFATGTSYYIVTQAASTITVSATPGGTAIVAGSAGSGVHTGYATAPTDGTGGAISGLTFSRSTSSPLRGTGSFSLVQTNSTLVAGQGVSYAFTIDSADQARALKVAFDYNASSTFVASSGQVGNDSDIEVFVYDVTNAVRIPVTPKVLVSRGTNSFQFSGVFQTAPNSTSYRLIMHAATFNANATGWTLKWDNVFVGPQATAQGPVIMDWDSSQPVTVNNAGTVTNQVTKTQRIGDTLYVRGVCTSGTATASPFSIALPSGLSIDSTKLPSNVGGTQVGTMYSGTGAIPGSSSGAFLLFYDGSTVGSVFAAVTSTTSAFTAANGTSCVNNNATLSFEFSVPIAGWSSNSVMSAESDTRVVALRAQDSATVISSAYATVVWTTAVNDTHAGLASGVYTVPVSGYYNVAAQVLVSGTQALNGTAAIQLQKNGATVQENSVAYGGAVTANNTLSISVQSVLCSAGDTLNIQVKSSATLPTIVASTSDNFFTVNRQSGAATIAASDTVAARYFASATSVSSALAAITYTTKDFDTHNAYSGGTYTVPVSGKYHVSASVYMTATTTGANQLIQLQIFKNGVVKSATNQYFTSTTSKPLAINLSDIVSFTAGDTLTIQASNAGSSPSISASNAFNYLAICRLGT